MKRASKTGEPIFPAFWSTEPDLSIHRMDKAKKKRASHRRNVTKLEGKVNDVIGESAEGINVMKLKHFQSELEEERIDLKELNNEILELLCDEADNDVIDIKRDLKHPGQHL